MAGKATTSHQSAQTASTTRPHGLMFHHFHGQNFPETQGSISASALARIVEHYAEHYNLLDAGEYQEKALSGQLGNGDVCLTFDDSLLCQYELALPVLQEHEVRAFWFVYSSVVTGNIEVLEVYRRFRTEHFTDVDEFYSTFFNTLEDSSYSSDVATALESYSPKHYLSEFTFYTDNDRKFRYVRDRALSSNAYEHVMNAMIQAAGTSLQSLSKGLWMNAGQLRALHDDGHVIGLHSHTHPTALAQMPTTEQHNEYADNRKILSEILGHTPQTMSHPCNSYSEDTLQVLSDLGITLGFRSNMSSDGYSPLEHPREDHANIIQRLGL